MSLTVSSLSFSKQTQVRAALFLSFNPFWFTFQSTDIDAPKDLKATDVTLDAAVLNWIAPLADIEGYILTYRDEDGNMKVLNHNVWHVFLTQTERRNSKRYLFAC